MTAVSARIFVIRLPTQTLTVGAIADFIAKKSKENKNEIWQCVQWLGEQIQAVEDKCD
jgi:hypothetical protein